MGLTQAKPPVPGKRSGHRQACAGNKDDVEAITRDHDAGHDGIRQSSPTLNEKVRQLDTAARNLVGTISMAKVFSRTPETCPRMSAADVCCEGDRQPGCVQKINMTGADNVRTLTSPVKLPRRAATGPRKAAKCRTCPIPRRERQSSPCSHGARWRSTH